MSKLGALLLSALLPHDTMHSVDYAVTRCLSVYLSVCHTPVFYRNSAKHIIKIFKPLCSLTVLFFFCFFFHTKPMAIRRDLPNGGVKCRGRVIKNRDFRAIYHFISEMMQDRAVVPKLSNGIPFSNDPRVT